MLARARKPVLAPSMLDGHVPAPTGGLNTVDGGSRMPATDCIQLYNLTPAEYGLRSRLGSREWWTGLSVETSQKDVRETFYYHGSAKDGSKNRLFVTCPRGIYDATTSRAAWSASTAYEIGDVVVNDDGKVYTCDTDGTSASSGGPTGIGANIADGTTRWDYTTTTKVLAFSTTSGDAGRGIFHSFITSAGYFLAYCDEENGYQLYTESTDTWAAGSLTGATPANMVFVGSWKHRLAFVEKDTGTVHFLPVGAISGVVDTVSATFGAKPRHGGDLVGIYNWTLDGGVGIDDHLVFVFRGGDVAVYQGTNPTSASTFAIRGVWFAGAIPKGRHVVLDSGGDLLILTKNGVRPLSLLVNGGGEGLGQYTTKKISNLFNSLMLSKSSIHGWSMHIHPEDNALMVTHPTTDGANTEQLVMSLATGGWSRYRDLPMYSAAAGGGKLYFGSVDGKVYINDGYIDGVTLADPNAYTAIQWSMLTGFTNLGNARQKQIQFIRPTILSEDASPSFSVGAKYKYNFTELDPVSGAVLGGDEWDSGLWDAALWSGEYQASQEVRGAVGMGVDMAIAARGTATSRTVVVGFDVGYTEGGFL